MAAWTENMNGPALIKEHGDLALPHRKLGTEFYFSRSVGRNAPAHFRTGLIEPFYYFKE
jgi:hypothetical protein